MPPPAPVSTDRRREASMIAAERPPSNPQITKTAIRDPVDVDARAAGRLGAAADRVDVAPEARPLGDERPEDEEARRG